MIDILKTLKSIENKSFTIKFKENIPYGPDMCNQQTPSPALKKKLCNRFGMKYML